MRTFRLSDLKPALTIELVSAAILMFFGVLTLGVLAIAVFMPDPPKADEPALAYWLGCMAIMIGAGMVHGKVLLPLMLDHLTLRKLKNLLGMDTPENHWLGKEFVHLMSGQRVTLISESVDMIVTNDGGVISNGALVLDNETGIVNALPFGFFYGADKLPDGMMVPRFVPAENILPCGRCWTITGLSGAADDVSRLTFRFGVFNKTERKVFPEKIDGKPHEIVVDIPEGAESEARDVYNRYRRGWVFTTCPFIQEKNQ